MNNIPKKQLYDLIIIGAGSGGLVAAELAAGFKSKVALVEAQAELGGECLHSGCVPSKALIHVARSVWQAGHSQELGFDAQLKLDFAKVKKHVLKAIGSIEKSHDNDDYYQHLGIDVIHGPAKFVDHRTILVNGRHLRARRFIIATGSGPLIPEIPGLNYGPFLTNETIFNLQSLPSSMIVIGGGPIGCELGQAFAMLGSQVTILQAGPRLLPRDELEAATILEASLSKNHITVHKNAQIERVTYAQNGLVEVSLKDHLILKAQKLLVATGRQARLPDGLEMAGVKYSSRGIVVNKRLQSSNKNIYAIGDCNGGLQFTHSAGQQAVVAILNALLGIRRAFDPNQISWTTFTTPEIAHIGPLKEQLNSEHINYRAVRIDFENIDKAVTENEHGFAEILINNHKNILGATVVGHNAAELLAQVIFAKNWNNLKDRVQAYPTYATGLRQAVAQYNLDDFLASRSGRLIKSYLKWRFRDAKT